MRLHSSPVFIALDFETSGSASHMACALGMCRIENLHISSEYYTLIKPPSSYVKYSHIHGLTWNDLKNQQDFYCVWPGIKDFIEDADFFIAHNATFDRRVLYGSCVYYNLEMPDQQFICTMKGARKKLPIRSKSLSSVCEYLNISLNHHKADSDARACAEIAIHLFKNGLTVSDMLLK